ncbi:MAG: hypothetical protein JXO22_02015, partial [Phycisphaerae bacterium]|nr:hypothetical protein [Phycisphaerae bacterium]
GGGTTNFASSFRELLESTGEFEIERISVESQTVQRAVLDEQVYFLWATRDDKFFLVIGAEEPQAELLAMLGGTGEKLAASERFKACRKKAGIAPKPLMCLYADVRSLVADFRTVFEAIEGELPPMVDGVLRECGVSATEALYGEIGDGELGIAAKLFIKIDGQRTGLLKFWDHEPLKQQDLMLIPQDAFWAAAFNLDWNMMCGETFRVLDELEPDAAMAVTGGLGMVQSIVGFSITDDLLPALGDTWILYDAPDHGGFLITGMAAIVDVRKADALQNIFSRLVELGSPALAEANAELSIMDVKHNGHTIHCVTVNGLPIPLAPAACFVKDRVVCGLSPQTVKIVLDRSFAKTAGPSILEQPDVKAVWPKMSKNAQSFYYTDNHFAMRSMYGLNLLIQTAMASMAPTKDFNAGSLPTLPEMLTDLHQGVAGWSADEDGLLFTSHGALMPAMSANSGLATTAMLTSILLPSLARARELAKRAVSQANLRGIGQCCYIYSNDHEEKFPPNLEVLIDANLATRKMLESPRHGPGVDAYVYIAGQTANDDARNILAYERPLGDEGTAVVYLDGHAEWVDTWRFGEDLRGTYKRLDREDEIPEEYREW